MDTLLIGALVAAGAAALTAAVQVLVGRRIPPEVLASAQGSVGDLLAAPTSQLYAVLVAFLLAGALDDYQDMRDTIGVEFNALINLARVAYSVSGPGGDDVRSATLAYARSVARDEWPRLAEGEPDPSTTAALGRLWGAITAFSPSSAGEANLQAAALELVTTIATQRRLRILATRRSIPALLWWILVIGGVIVVGYGLFTALRSRRLQVALVIGPPVLVALSLFAIYVLTNPMQFDLGLDRIGSDALRRVLDQAPGPL